MKPLRIGLVGLHAHHHADAMETPIAGLELVAVADEGEGLARSWAEPRGLHWTTDAMALIARDDVDAVILASPTAAYADQVEAAAALGKHVLLDKAVLTSLAEADRIVAASRKVKVLMAYLLRFVPSYVEVRDAMQRGAIGRLKSGFYSTRMPFEPGASLAGTDGIASPAELADPDVGRLLDHEAHFADFFRWFSGSEPISVIATVGSSVCPELQINDYGIATYTLDNGATVTLESTRHVALDGASPPLWGPDRATVTGTKGEIEFHYQQLPQIEIQGGDGEWPRRYADEFSRGRSQDVYRNLLIEFRDIIAEDREPSPSAADGRAALEMVLAAHEAANTRRRVSFPYTADRHSAHATGSLQTHRAAI